MKPYDKADYKRQVRFRLMECESEEDVFNLIEKLDGDILNKDEDMVRAFAGRLNHIEDLQAEKFKSHKLFLN
jgi:hypothetical protein